jgi:hypothetical protein
MKRFLKLKIAIPLVTVVMLVSAVAVGLASHTLGQSHAAATSVTPIDAPNLNWAGYISEGTTYSIVSGAWVVPKVDCASRPLSKLGIWVGIGGTSATYLEQTGIHVRCPGIPTTYTAFYENYPTDPVDVRDACHLSSNSTSTGCASVPATIRAGDRMQAIVSFNQQDRYGLTLFDLSQNWVFSTVQTVPGVVRDSAECIVERPGAAQSLQSPFIQVERDPITRFDATNFSSCSANKTSIASAGPRLLRAFVTDNGHANDPVLLDTGVLLTKDGSFSVIWRRSGGFVITRGCFIKGGFPACARSSSS